MRTMRPKYVNAGKNLPPALCAALRAELGGGGVFVWVPNDAVSERQERAERRADRVVSLWLAGHPVRDIAATVRLSLARCYQIIAEFRQDQWRIPR